MGAIQAIVTGYKMGRAGKLVERLLIVEGGMDHVTARYHTDFLMKFTYENRVTPALLTWQLHAHPHKAAVAASALSVGVTGGMGMPSLEGLYHASYAALGALLKVIGPDLALHPYHPLNEMLLDAACAAFNHAKSTQDNTN